MEAERKIGEIFEFGGEWYQCVVAMQGCRECSFRTQDYCTRHSECMSTERSDKTSVIFKKLEKVGEPYRRWLSPLNSIMVQRYRLYGRNVIMPDEPYMYFNEIDNTIEIEIKQIKEDMEDLDKIKVRDYTKVEELNVMEEKKLNLKPFDIQKAREGKPVCTRDGRKARIVCFDAKMKRNIIALIQDNEFKDEEIAVEYFPNGCFYDNDFDTSLDLMMPPEKKEGWINVYKMKESTFGYITAYFDTEEKAKENKEQLTGYVATVKINWEE